MKSRIVQAGAAAGVGLGLVLVVGALVGAPWLSALAVAGLGVFLCVGVADVDRRVRRLEKVLSTDGVAGVEPPAPQVTEADVLGTVRLLQAQYTGRLDRLQHTVEALASTTSADRSGSPTAP